MLSASLVLPEELVAVAMVVVCFLLVAGKDDIGFLFICYFNYGVRTHAEFKKGYFGNNNGKLR
jgi:hypothetical protein